MEKIDERLILVHDENCGLMLIHTLELIKLSYVAFQWEVPRESSSRGVSGRTR